MTERPTRVRADYEAVVVGSGFAGIAMAIALKRQGIHDFVVLEKGDDLGGTWRDNTYPGCACDVPSHLYSYSFELKADWSRAYASAPEILDYVRHCCTKYGLDPHLRFGYRLDVARYEEESGLWRLTVRTPTGIVQARCRTLVMAVGALHEPARPDIAGLDDFGGPVVHTAAWDHSVTLQGKRVGVIGTGASAIQVVPQVAPATGRLTVFQRTPPWVLPKEDPEYSPAAQRRFARWPWLAWLKRAAIYWTNEARVVGFARHPRAMKVAERMARRHLHAQVADPDLRERLTPDYTIGCKRILVSSDYYPALQRDNVHLETAGIDHVENGAVVTTDGRRHELDVLVLATGFDVIGTYQHLEVVGRDGRNLGHEWAKAPEAYLGTTVEGFPNLFTLVGPNTGLGHTSMLIMIEAQAELVLRAMRERDRRQARAVEVEAAAQEAFNDELQRRSASAVWLTGCRSWYLDDSGVNRALWPWSTVAYRRRTARFQPGHYRFHA